jgi:hypothetical protein
MSLSRQRLLQERFELRDRAAPLDRFKLTVGDDGQLVVDKSKIFKGTAGADPTSSTLTAFSKLNGRKT